MLRARAGEFTPEIALVAADERLPGEAVRTAVAEGRIVIPANPRHAGLQPVGIGRGLRVKVNTNLGTSTVSGSADDELAKLELALRLGTDTVMDLSTGPSAADLRRRVLTVCPRPVGTVPLYDAVSGADDPADLSPNDFLSAIEAHAEIGVDFMTLHAGVLRRHIPLVDRRLAGVVSRGGGLIIHWMRRRGWENPLYERFDDVLDICRAHDVTLSLGDGLRPGCLADASDEAQFAELGVLGELVRRSRAAGVQAMVEGPGHVPLHQIADNMRREREACDDAPFYVLGPLVADCAPGYDHITGAIGGAWAAFHGAAMLCYVTPAEHLGLPDLEDVRQGLVAFRLAAHAADVALGHPGARERNDAISGARARLDWASQFAHALDPSRAREIRDRCLARSAAAPAKGSDWCTMCGPKFCPMRLQRMDRESTVAS